MNELLVISSASMPVLVAGSDERTRYRFLEFFTAQIRNSNTRRAYLRDVSAFLDWCDAQGVREIGDINTFHVAAYIELLTRSHSAPTTKRQLSAIRRLFDWLVMGQVVTANPTISVKGPKFSQRKGKTPILDADEARQLLGSIDVSTLIGLRDRALIAVMLYTFGRVSAATAMKVEDVVLRQRRLWVRLHEKGGKEHEMPCHHALEAYLDAWLDASGLRNEPKAPLFPTIRRGTGVGRRIGELTRTRMMQQDAYRAMRRHAIGAGVAGKIGNHSMRGTGITAYLKNGGSLEKARDMANHADTRTTQLYDRRSDDVTLDEVERILI